MSLADPAVARPTEAAAPLPSLSLAREQILSDRPFTDPNSSSADLRALNRSVCRLRAALHAGLLRPLPLGSNRLLGYAWEDDADLEQRILLRAGVDLRQIAPLVLVGFFGQRRRDGDRAAITAMDTTLVEDFAGHTGLLCYYTSALPNGDYANLVLCASEGAKAHWNSSPDHVRAVRELSPRYYQSIRLHNGRLEHGLGCSGGPQLTLTKYYDYEQPAAPGVPWRAHRAWSPPLAL